MGSKKRVKRASKKPASVRAPKRISVVIWMRSAGIAAAAFGAGALILSEYFWPANALIYLGGLLLLIDLCFEAGLSRFRKILIAAALLGLVGAFGAGVTFKDAPISVSAIGPKFDYADGTNVGSIKWKAAFTGVRLSVSNLSADNLTDFVAVFRTDQPIVVVAQRSTIPNCFFQTLNHASPLITMPLSVTGIKDPDLQLLATTDAYVMRCQSVPAQSEVEIDVAIASVDNSQNLMERKLWGRSTKGAVLDVDLRRAGIGHYWFGNPDDNVYVRSPPPQSVRVWVDYRATFKPHHSYKEIELLSPATHL